MSNFKKDILIGRIGEQKAKIKIMELNNVYIISECNDFRYDFETSDMITYEVNLDLMSSRTGNLFIEFLGNFGQLSGIGKTEADYQIVISSETMYKISVIELKQMTHNKRIVSGREGSKGYLIPISLLQPYII